MKEENYKNVDGIPKETLELLKKYRAVDLDGKNYKFFIWGNGNCWFYTSEYLKNTPFEELKRCLEISQNT